MATSPPTRPGTPLRDRPIAGAEPARRRPASVYVEVLVDDVARPGLLLQWRQAGDGTWMAHTTFAVLDDADPVVVTQWVPASHIRPAHPHH